MNAFDLIQKIINDKNYEKEIVLAGLTILPKWKLINYLQDSHIFMFNQRANDWVNKKTTEKIENYKGEDPTKVYIPIFEQVEDLSIPYSTTLYITNKKPSSDNQIFAYLLKETSPENVTLCMFFNTKSGPKVIHYKNIFSDDDFQTIHERNVKASLSNIVNITKCHFLCEAISVKRIGIERTSISLYDKRTGSKKKFRSEQVYHIAGKTEYEYVEPLNRDSSISWEISGFWRGHWRATYKYDSSGKKVKDELGRNVVDYTKMGKDRAGNRNVPGYTWVIEHTKGPIEKLQKKMHKVNPSKELIINMKRNPL